MKNLKPSKTSVLLRSRLETPLGPGAKKDGCFRGLKDLASRFIVLFILKTIFAAPHNLHEQVQILHTLCPILVRNRSQQKVPYSPKCCGNLMNTEHFGAAGKPPVTGHHWD